MLGRVSAALCAAVVAANPAAADPPCALPPLLPVPDSPVPGSGTPVSPPSSGPSVEYDRSLLYLPDAVPRPSFGHIVPAEPEGKHFWFTGGLLLGWSDPQSTPVLLAGPTGALFGNDGSSLPLRAGYQLDGGLWLNADRTWAVEGGGLYLSPRTARADLAFLGDVPVGRPTLSPAGAGLDPLSGLGRTGGFSADWSTRFATGDVNFRREIFRNEHLRVAATAGYRVAYLAETLGVGSATQTGDGIVRYEDRAETRTMYHAGQLGLSAGASYGPWTVDAIGKVGLGVGFGTTDLTGMGVGPGGEPLGGFLARPANVGERQDARFCTMPSLAVNVGRHVFDRGRVFLGYSLTYLTGVARPGDLLTAGDPGGSGVALVRGTGPSDFWIRGVNVGMEWAY